MKELFVFCSFKPVSVNLVRGGFKVCSLALFASLFILGGCGGQVPKAETRVIPYTPEQVAAREEASGANYRIKAGDVLKIAFKFEKDLDQNGVLVLPDGYVSMIGLDSGIKAAGLTLHELDSNLTQAYAADYREPGLSVIVSEISKPEIYVMGMVSHPGLFKIPYRGMGVMQAIALAGGFQEDASKSNTVVMRATDAGFMVRSIDFSHIEETGFPGMENFDLQPYDVVYVPRSGFGDFTYFTKAVFGSAINITRFFWDIYAISNLDKIDRIVR